MEKGIYIGDEFINEDELIILFKNFFRTNIASKHLSNTKKLKNIDEFIVNPFLNKYLANFLTGNTSNESIAKALIYPRILGTSITTTFGTNMQKFITEELGSRGSLASGMDIEFRDHIDNRVKYCQVKAGPTTINKDDITTICSAFQGVINLGRTNNLAIAPVDCIVGVLYGDRNDLSSFYKTIDKTYPVYIGQEFWHRLTGSNTFFDRMTDSIAEIAKEFDSKELIDQTIASLARQLENEAGF